MLCVCCLRVATRESCVLLLPLLHYSGQATPHPFVVTVVLPPMVRCGTAMRHLLVLLGNTRTCLGGLRYQSRPVTSRVSEGSRRPSLSHTSSSEDPLSDVYNRFQVHQQPVVHRPTAAPLQVGPRSWCRPPLQEWGRGRGRRGQWVRRPRCG